MLQKQKLLLLFLIFSYSQVSFSQVEKPKKDSTEVYRSIQNYSKKRKFTSVLYQLIFRPVDLKRKKEIVVVPTKYSSFEGKIIRKINVVTLDPFGFSEIDSTRGPRNWAEETGNRIHIKTRRLAIKNLLLIRKNRPLDSLLVKESERLLRTQRYINRANISPQLIENNPDSVDVIVRVLDSWSIIPKGSVSKAQSSFALNERNFLGSGHEFDTRYKSRFSDGKKAYNLTYSIPNIKNTYIRTTFNYYIDLDNYHAKSVNIERPFYSPFIKWAGGIFINEQYRQDTLQDSNLKYAKQNFKYNSQDVWGGHAFRLFKGNTEGERTTNLIFSGRFLNIKYLESPTVAYDPIDFYSGEKLFLSGIGISSRKFVRENYIFKNGPIEDVPIGRIFGITGGYQYKNNTGRYYFGGRAAFGNFYKWGFLSTNFELGSFFDKSTTNQTAFSFQANYFTNLISIGKWKLRQFIKPQYILGINRLNSIGDQLTINGDYGINGFNSALYGTQKAVLTLQTQAYSTWDLWGFRLNPYFNYSIAVLGNAEKGLNGSKSYSKIGFGFIINNDYLVFSSFQISFAYYPSIPLDGSNVFKTNAFQTTNFGFQDFELAKPRTVIFK